MTPADELLLMLFPFLAKRVDEPTGDTVAQQICRGDDEEAISLP